MTELIDRYLHQVGRYLPAQTRADITAELRSQIQDQLDDRYPAEPTAEQVAAVLRELGSPRQMAASYREPQYLIGPDLYPMLIEVLRYGWLIIPLILVFLGLFGRMIAPTDTPLINWLLETLWATVQAALIFSGAVVLLFALVRRSGLDLSGGAAFDPLTLPAVNDPRTVERRDTAFSLAAGVVVMLVWLYFLRVGGLTLRFDLSNPGDVIPVPVHWLLALIIMTILMVVLQLLALRRSRWSVSRLLAQTMLELIGAFCMYFVFFRPLYERLLETAPALLDIPLFDRSPEIVAALLAIITLLDKGSKLVRMLNYRRDAAAPITVKTGG